MGPMANKEVREEHLTTDLPRNASEGAGVTCEQSKHPCRERGHAAGVFASVLQQH
jgi:hypothetical protein